ncbi:MAG TPA: ferric reductase-like transmembrane domain-containing protein [Blastococcus sp.]|jgi:predicted ferric reductase|nr:ferric reductase-like transmembrane domain-containing protein [Blastococcus sp.]
MTNALWYFGRGAGVSALVLFTLVVVLGIVVRIGRPLPGLPRFTVAAVHRTTSLTALGFLVLHVGSLLFDPYAQLRLFDTVVPFAGNYKPLWQGLGTLALDLVLLLIASSLLRHRIGLRAWRWLHWSAYLCWPVALAHAVGNGTDGTSTWMLGVVGGCVVAVAGALAWRMNTVGAEPDLRQVAPPSYLAGLR